MICFTASHKFKNMHQRITDKESVDANAQALRLTWGSNPVTELPFTNRQQEQMFGQRQQQELRRGAGMKFKASRSP